MRHPILMLAAAGLLGVTLWKLVLPLLFPLLFTLLKIAFVVALVLFVIWVFNNKKSKDREKPAE